MASTLVTRRRMVAGCGLALTLAGCGGLPLGNSPPKLYTLTPKSSFSADLPKVDWQLAIDQPTSPVALATSRIAVARGPHTIRSEEHTSELQSLIRTSYAVFCLKKKTKQTQYK